MRRIWPTAQSIDFVLIILVSIFVLCLFRPWDHPIYGDTAIHEYMSYAIFAGKVPYRDVFELESALSSLIGALAKEILTPLGFNHLMASRLLGILIFICNGLLLYRLAGYFQLSRLNRLVAPLILLSFSYYCHESVMGVRAKIYAIFFGLLTLIHICKKRWFISGLFGMCACLCWQPALIFVGPALWLTLFAQDKLERKKFFLVILGLLIPLVAYLLYFVYYNALYDLIDATTYGLFYAESQLKGPKASIFGFFKAMVKGYNHEILFFITGFLGFLLSWFSFLRKKDRGWILLTHDNQVFPTGLCLLAWVIFAFINFQGEGDLLVFLPLISLYTAQFLECVKGWIVRVINLSRPYLIPIVLSFITLVYGFHDLRWQTFKLNLNQQRGIVEEYAVKYGGPIKVFTVGFPEANLFLNRTEKSRYFYIPGQIVRFMEQKQPGSFDRYVRSIDPLHFPVVYVGRVLKGDPYHERLMRHLMQHYSLAYQGEAPLPVEQGSICLKICLQLGFDVLKLGSRSEYLIELGKLPKKDPYKNLFFIFVPKSKGQEDIHPVFFDSQRSPAVSRSKI